MALVVKVLASSCLENPMDRGAWWVTVHGVTKSWMLLKWLSMHACILEEAEPLVQCDSYLYRLPRCALKNLPASIENSRDVGLIPRLGRSPVVGNGNPLLYSHLQNSMNRRVVGYSSWGRKESDSNERLNTHTHTHLYKGDNLDTDLHTGRMSHRLSFAAINQGTTRSLERGLTDPCLVLSKTTWFLTSSPQNCEIMHFWFFRHSVCGPFLEQPWETHVFSFPVIACLVLRSAPSGLTWTMSTSVARGVDGGALAHRPAHRAGAGPVLDNAHVPRVGKR